MSYSDLSREELIDRLREADADYERLRCMWHTERLRAEDRDEAVRLLTLVLLMAKAFAIKSDVGCYVDYILEAEEFIERQQSPRLATVQIEEPASR